MTENKSAVHPGIQDKYAIAAKILLIALVYFVTGRLGLEIPYVGTHITLIWLPTGIAVVSLMRWGNQLWPGIFLGALATNYSVDASPVLDSCIAVGNTLAPLLSAQILRRLKFHGKFDRAYDILILVLAATAGMLVSASGGVGSLVSFNLLPVQDAGAAWLTWWAGDFIGVLLVSPLLLNVSRAEISKLWAQRLEFLLWTSIMVMISWGVFLINNNDANIHSLPLGFIVLPAVVWSAMRFGVMGSSLAVLSSSLIAVVATSLGLGPFYNTNVHQGLFLMSMFLTTLVLVNLMVGALQAGRRRVEEAVIQDRDFILEMIQTLPGIFYMFDASGRFLMWNKQLESVLQRSSIEIAHSNPLDFFEGEDRDLIEQNIRKAFEFGDTVVEAVLVAKNGSRIPYHFTGRRIERNGEPVLVGMGVDITERQRIQKETEALLRRYQTLMKTSIDAIRVMDMQGNVVEANDAFCQMMGYTHEEALKLNIADWDAQWSKEELLERLKGFIGRSGAIFETVQRRKNGSLIEVEVSATGVEIDGKHYVVASSRDITERKRNEQRNEVLLKRQQVLMMSSLEGIHIMDINGNIVEFNDTFCELLGYSREEAARLNVSDWDATWSREELMERFRKLIKITGAVFETRHRRKDGTVIDVEVSTTGAEIEGQLYLYATSRDITERKKIEEVQRIAAVTFDTQEAIMITTPDANILRVNQAFQDITGYSADEVIGCNPSIFKSGRHDSAFYQSMWSELRDTGKWGGEVWDKRKNGEIYPKLLTITAVYDDKKQLTHYVGVFRDISNRKKSEQEIHQLAFYDLLTRLPNRRLLMDRLQQALAISARNDRHGALLFLDLDHFKTINDTQGHTMGDQLLTETARRLQACVREGDSVARLGGDEFVVVLENLSSNVKEAAAQTESIAEKIRLELNKPYILNDFECLSTVSIGISLFFNHKESADSLLQHADVAMYQAKMAGRNTLRFFDPLMQATLEARAALEADLRYALQRRQFSLCYQVQVDSLRRPLGAEVLLRWHHPEQGDISPSQFIPLAEETGLIVPIGLWVMQTACAQLKKWQDDPLTRDLKLAVNVSAKQFRQPDFVAQAQRVLLDSGAKPSHLKMEFTESTVLENVEDTISKMRELKLLGVGFSVDDFGTGYSSLQYLKRLPLDQIKIDQSFVRDVVSDPNDAAIVQTIIAMTEALGLEVIAEGVETEAQRKFLDLHGCHNFQGYLFSKPVPLSQFEELLRRGKKSPAHSSALP